MALLSPSGYTHPSQRYGMPFHVVDMHFNILMMMP